MVDRVNEEQAEYARRLRRGQIRRQESDVRIRAMEKFVNVSQKYLENGSMHAPISAVSSASESHGGYMVDRLRGRVEQLKR